MTIDIDETGSMVHTDTKTSVIFAACNICIARAVRIPTCRFELFGIREIFWVVI